MLRSSTIVVALLTLLPSGCGSPSIPSSAGGDAQVSTPPVVSQDPASTRTGCAIGEMEARPCGACGTGEAVRICTRAGRFGAWSACGGVDLGLSVAPSNGAPICEIGESPAVFFAPHPDDESIGMAGAILAARAQGRPVFIELMTHGEASGARAKLSDGHTDSWHPGKHDHPLSVAAFGDARVAELLDAASRLDVTGVHVNRFRNGGLTPGAVRGRIDYWIERGGPGLSLAGTAGPQDPEGPGGTPHPDHLAVWNALVESRFADVTGYLVYEHQHHAGAPAQVRSIAPFCEAKVDVLRAYGEWAPEVGRYAIGYHSVRTLIHDAGTDCVEYVVKP